MLRERPSNVFANECGSMSSPRFERGHDCFAALRVAQCYRDVAQPSFVPDAPDRGALEAPVEVLLGPCEELDQRGRVQAVAWVEVGERRDLGPLVPRAHELAIVAAV